MDKNVIVLKFPYKSKPEYVGLKMKAGKVEFTFPVGYYEEKKEDIKKEILDEEYRKIILNILRLMSRYREPENIGDYNAENTNFPIEAFLWVIRDFIENGYYKDIEVLYKINGKGKINWKKTIKNNKLFFNNSFVYRELITKQNKFDIENEITEIHRFCVRTAINTFGFLYGLPYKKVDNRNLEQNVKIRWKQILLKELSNSFNDHKRLLLKNLIDMLESLDFDKVKKNEFSLVAKDFNYVFECLVDEKFGTEDTKEYNPSGKWVLENGEEFPSTDIRPDTIREDKKNIYIIDSKYYMYGYTKNIKHLPETSSIHKQITYAQYINIKRNSNKKKVYNIFILPKNCNFSNDEISYIGYAMLADEDKEYDHIYTFLIDLRKLVEGKLSQNCFEEKIKSKLKQNEN